MTDAKTTRELVYETNRDVKWICKTRRAAGCDVPSGTELEHRQVGTEFEHRRTTFLQERSLSTGGAKVRVAT